MNPLVLAVALVATPFLVLMAAYELRYRRQQRRIAREGAVNLGRLNAEAQEHLTVALAARDVARAAYAEVLAIHREQRG
jgi:hypothetical protein